MRKYRYQVPMLVLLMMFAVQLVYLVTAFNVIGGLRSEKAEDDFNALYDNLIDRLGKQINDLNTLGTVFNDSVVTDYTEENTALLLQYRYNELIGNMEKYLDQLDLPSDVVERILIIGDTSNRSPYNKPVDRRGFVDHDLPSWSELVRSGKAPLINYTYKEPIYYEKDQLNTYTVPAEGAELSGVQRARVTKFCKLLEDRLVFARSSRFRGSYIFIIVKPDFLKKYLVRADGLTVTLADGQNRTIWTNAETKAGDKVQETVTSDGRWFSYANGQTYENKSVSFPAANLRLTVNRNLSVDFGGSTQLLSFLILFFAVPLFCGVVSYVMTRIVMAPFAVMAGEFRAQFDNEYHAIAEPRKNFGISGKLFITLGVSLILPALVTGLFYTVSLTNYAREVGRSRIYKVAENITSNLEGQLDSARQASNVAPVEELSAYITNESGTIGDRASLGSLLRSRLSESGSFSYYVLYNASGRAVYDSVNLSDDGSRLSKSFDLDSMLFIRSVYKNTENPFILTDRMLTDASGSTAVAVMRTLNGKAVSDAGRVETKVEGYFGMFLDLSRFHLARPDAGQEFAVVDKTGLVIYRSDGSRSKADTVASIVSATRAQGPGEINLTTVNGTEYAVVVTELARDGLYVHTYSDMRESLQQNTVVLLSNLMIVLLVSIFVCLFAWIFARRLLKPVRSMKNDMARISEGESNRPVEYESEDEISELVDAYNAMVARMGKLIEDNAQRRIRERELLTMQMQVELRMLQQQINPHLLYNTLEFINYHASKDGQSIAGTMAVALAKLFRYTTSMNEETVRFSAEVEHVRNYIAIHMMRFENRFQARFEITPEAENCRVLKFILQPAVENSFKYGFRDKTAGAEIRISAFVVGGKLHISISDNGAGMRPSQLEQLRERLCSQTSAEEILRGSEANARQGGVGLVNVSRRLRMFYGDQASMAVSSEFMKGLTVEIVLPAEPY